MKTADELVLLTAAGWRLNVQQAALKLNNLIDLVKLKET